jgi:hypothetical protein
MPSKKERWSPDTIALLASSREGAGSSTLSVNSFASKQGVEYQEPTLPKLVYRAQLRVRIPEEIELQAYPRQVGSASTDWADSPQTTLFSPSTALPTAHSSFTQFTSSLVSFQGLLADMLIPNDIQAPAKVHPKSISFEDFLADMPTSSKIQAPPRVHSKWVDVQDAIAVKELTRYRSLFKPGKIVGLQPKILHAIVEHLDPGSAICKSRSNLDSSEHC